MYDTIMEEANTRVAFATKAAYGAKRHIVLIRPVESTIRSQCEDSSGSAETPESALSASQKTHERRITDAMASSSIR